jgi:hypothetical protein
MSTNQEPRRLLLAAPLPGGLLLLGLFFMPWVNVRCDTDAAAGSLHMANVPPGFQEAMAEAEHIGTASGWELAGGDISLSGKYRDDPGLFAEKVPQPRPWMYALLALPVLIAILSFAGLTQMTSPAAAGKWLVSLALFGAAMTAMASRVDIASDMADSALEDAEGKARICAAAFNESKKNAESQLQRVIKTRPTTYVWVSLGGYALVGVFGAAAIVVLGAGEPDKPIQASSPPERIAVPNFAMMPKNVAQAEEIQFGEELIAKPDPSVPQPKPEWRNDRCGESLLGFLLMTEEDDESEDDSPKTDHST